MPILFDVKILYITTKEDFHSISRKICHVLPAIPSQCGNFKNLLSQFLWKKNSWNQLIHKWNYISYWFHVISDTESKFPFFSTLYCALIFNEMEKFHLYSKIAISEQILKTFLKVMTLVSNLVLLTLDRPIPMIRYQMNVFVKYTSVIIVSHTVWKFRKLLKLCKENNTYIWFRKAGLSIKEKQKLNWF